MVSSVRRIFCFFLNHYVFRQMQTGHISVEGQLCGETSHESGQNRNRDVQKQCAKRCLSTGILYFLFFCWENEFTKSFLQAFQPCTLNESEFFSCQGEWLVIQSSEKALLRHIIIFIRNSPESQSFPASKGSPIGNMLTVGILRFLGEPLSSSARFSK